MWRHPAVIYGRTLGLFWVVSQITMTRVEHSGPLASRHRVASRR